jgi:hypothetical protein
LQAQIPGVIVIITKTETTTVQGVLIDEGNDHGSWCGVAFNASDHACSQAYDTGGQPASDG